MSLATRQAWQARLFGGEPVAELTARRTNARPEAALLNAIMSLLRNHPKVAWRVRLNSGAFTDARGQFVRFGFVGCPDIWAMMRGTGKLLVIEVKAPGGKLTEAQELFLERVRRAGGHAGVARSIQDAINIVEGRW
jgi:VRR-NUC domain